MSKINLSDVNSELRVDSLHAKNPFILSDGTKVFTILGLIKKLETMNEEEYSKYANINKNDFSIWIHNEFGLTDLAESIRYRTRINTILEIKRFLREKNDTISNDLEKIEENIQSVRKELEMELNEDNEHNSNEPNGTNTGNIESHNKGYNEANYNAEIDVNHNIDVNTEKEKYLHEAKNPNLENNPKSNPESIILEDAITKNIEKIKIENNIQDNNRIKNDIKNNNRINRMSIDDNNDVDNNHINNNHVSNSPKTHDIKETGIKQQISQNNFETPAREKPEINHSIDRKKIRNDPRLEKIEYLLERINRINKIVDEQHIDLRNKNNEIRILKETIKKQKKDIRNYEHNLNRLIEENKRITSHYLKLKEKESYLRKLELEAKEKIKKAELMFDKLNKIKNIPLDIEDTKNIDREERKLDRMIENEEIEESNIPIYNEKERKVEIEEEEEIYDIELIEKEIDKLTKKIESKWKEFNLDIYKK